MMTIMTILQLLLLLYLIVLINGANKEKDTTTTATKFRNDSKHHADDLRESSENYHQHIRDIDELLSTSIIKSLPIMHFFDHDKRLFKIGFLGQEMLKTNQSLFQDLVSVIDKKFIQRSKIEVVKDLLVADYNSIFFHSLKTLHRAMSIHKNLEQRALRIHERFSARLLATEISYNKTFSGMKSLISLRLYNEVLEKRISSVSNKKRYEAMKSSSREKNLDYFHNEMKDEITRIHDSLNENVLNKMNRLSTLRLKRIEESLKIFRVAEMERSIGEIHDIAVQQNDALITLSEENTQRIELGKFRITEEMRIMKENEKIVRNIQVAKTESSIEGFKAILKFCIGELTNLHNSLTSKPRQTLMYISFILLSFVFTIILYEIVVSLKFIFIKCINSETLRFARSPLQNTKTLIFSENLEKKMNDYLDLVTHSASQQGPMPIMLLYGKSGSGKSSIAEHLASKCALSAQVISVSDVLASDPKDASIFFRKITSGSNKYGVDTFDGYKKKSKPPTLIVLDDADELIESRALRRKGTDSESSAGCFYTLLEAARSASRDISIILTSRLSPSKIDGAVIDRVDFICHLTPPNPFVRFKYIIQRFEECFTDIMDEKSKSIFVDIITPEKMEESFKSIVSSNNDTALVAPETAAPETSHPFSSPSTSSYGTVYMISDVSTTSFDVKLCINSLVSHSEGRSYRDIAKFILNTQLLVLGTPDCCIRDVHFMQELRLFLSNLDYYACIE